MTSSLKTVVVTGMGAVSPLGLTLKTSWKALLQSRCGVTTLQEALRHQNLSNAERDEEWELLQELPCQVAAPVPNWEAKDGKRTSRNVQFALEAARQAMEQSKLLEWLALQRGINDNSSSSSEWDKNNPNPVDYRIGVSMGCGMSSLRDIATTHQTFRDNGYRKITPHFVPKSLTNSAAGRLSIEYGLLGPNCTTSTACAAASHAIGDAFRVIQLGQADVMLAGGSESSLEPVGLAGFCRLRALSTRFSDSPEASSRPFDTERDGFVMGEGAAVLVLEELEHARARGAPLLAKVIGYGMAGDGHHITAPDPNGRGAEHAMRMALGNVSQLDNVDYVNAHATSTPIGDEIEANVIGRLLCSEESSRPVHVSSTKGATGHLLGAAGAIEAAFTVQALADQMLPPTLNLENVEEEPKFQHVLSKQEADLRIAVSNSFGFGGTNASLAFQRIE